MRKYIRRVLYFFPIQLFFIHIKRNHFLLIFLLILLSFVTGVGAKKYGIPFLFLEPEYLGKIDFWSHFIVGIVCGGFIIAFNIASYIMNGPRFPFLATLSRPFLKYCLNNFIIPGGFVIAYIVSMIKFQSQTDAYSGMNIAIRIFGFLGGMLLLQILAISYFFSTNKDIFKMFGVDPIKDDAADEDEEDQDEKKINPIDRVLNKDLKRSRSSISRDSRAWHVETYFSSPLKIRLARGTEHYEKEMLMMVFEQNHLNAAVFEIGVFIILITLGYFRETPGFEIPAGASIFLLFTMFLMLFSALHSWLRGWSTTVFIAIILLINHFSGYEFFNYRNKAYGLDYNTVKAEYSVPAITPTEKDKQMFEEDKRQTIEILNKWRLKNSENSIQKGTKPKFVIINTSGGGLRSMLWTFHSLVHADSALGGNLMPQVELITGSSGGMIGASYLRELYYRQQLGEIPDFYHDTLVEDISKDMLNPIAFSIAVNDLFLRLRKFELDGDIYIKDRAFAFEDILNKNTHYLMDKRLGHYELPEKEAIIPMMIFTPSIKNDGRRLFISPQPISYLTHNLPSENVRNEVLFDGVEYTRMFKEQKAMDVQFTSVLRMNATFPYILPIPSLPSEPKIEIMDAGIRDNYGIKTTIKFIHEFKEWISTNTSGIVILQIRDKHKVSPVEDNPLRTVGETFTSPVGSFYDNLFNIQDYNHDQLVQYMSTWFPGEIDIINFQMYNEDDDHVSLSWHLTPNEKKKIMSAIDLPENQAAIEELKQLLNP